MTTNELYNKMAVLLEDMKGKEPIEFSEKSIAIINEIADFAEQTKIYTENKDKGEMLDNYNAEQVYGYMLDRIVNAPIQLYVQASLLCIMPVLRDKVNKERKNNERQESDSGRKENA